jgi:aminobenzoyl-glutamate utilization protein B
MDYSSYLQKLDENAERLYALSDQIWDKAEISHDEKESSKLLMDFLAKEGFTVKPRAYGLPTAFTAEYGAGSPRIGLLGEYDALSLMSQQADVFEKCPVVSGASVNGHGCGHQLLGTGALGAALAAKDFLQQSGKPGTIVYYGCPAEESGSGKAFMTRAGAFKDLEAALTWHPGTLTTVFSERSLANIMVKYFFHGVSSHAGAAPEMGRSALDAVELMSVGVNYLREHMIDDARVHYAVTNSGGVSPNVVQADADVVYLIRAPEMVQVQELFQRVNDIASGAALMTGTSMRRKIIVTCSNFISNRALEGLLYESLTTVPLPEISKADREYLVKYSATCTTPPDEMLKITAQNHPSRPGRAFLKEHLHDQVYDFVAPWDPDREDKIMRGSTDVGDVSWQCPTAQFFAATWAPGSPGHSWQIVAQGKSHTAHAMTLYSAKVLALAALRLFSEPALIAAARGEFAEEMRERSYFPVPAEAQPGTLPDL